MTIDTLPTVDNLPSVDRLGFELALADATTVSFTAPSTIGDTGNGLGEILVGEKFVISGAGAGANAGLTVTASVVLPGSITIEEATLTTQLAGGQVVFTRAEGGMPGLGHENRYEGANSSSPGVGARPGRQV